MICIATERGKPDKEANTFYWGLSTTNNVLELEGWIIRGKCLLVKQSFYESALNSYGLSKLLTVEIQLAWIQLFCYG
jgi:hypothetical protein